MGAWLTEERAEGRNASEAYKAAMAASMAYGGHQDGYSGTIVSKAQGFTLVTLPPRQTYRKLQALLEEADECGAEYERDNLNWLLDLNRQGKARKAEVDRARRAYEKAKVRDRKFAEKVERAGYFWSDFRSLAAQYNAKWEAPLCVELPTREAKPSKRGRRVYVFFGYAPC